MFSCDNYTNCLLSPQIKTFFKLKKNKLTCKKNRGNESIQSSHLVLKWSKLKSISGVS